METSLGEADSKLSILNILVYVNGLLFKSMTNEKKSLKMKLEELNSKRELTKDEKDRLKSLLDSKNRMDLSDERQKKMLNKFFGSKKTSIYVDFKGNPISSWEWEHLYTTKGDIKKDYIGDFFVSTVYVGIDVLSSNTVKPVIFKTMIFEVSEDEPKSDLDLSFLDLSLFRYSTIDEALQGHQQACQMVRDYLEKKQPVNPKN